MSARSVLLQDTIDLLDTLEVATKRLKEDISVRGVNATKGRHVNENLQFFADRLIELTRLAIAARAHWVALEVVASRKFSK